MHPPISHIFRPKKLGINRVLGTNRGVTNRRMHCISISAFKFWIPLLKIAKKMNHLHSSIKSYAAYGYAANLLQTLIYKKLSSIILKWLWRVKLPWRVLRVFRWLGGCEQEVKGPQERWRSSCCKIKFWNYLKDLSTYVKTCCVFVVLNAQNVVKNRSGPSGTDNEGATGWSFPAEPNTFTLTQIAITC